MQLTTWYTRTFDLASRVNNGFSFSNLGQLCFKTGRCCNKGSLFAAEVIKRRKKMNFNVLNEWARGHDYVTKVMAFSVLLIAVRSIWPWALTAARITIGRLGCAFYGMGDLCFWFAGLGVPHWRGLNCQKNTSEEGRSVPTQNAYIRTERSHPLQEEAIGPYRRFSLPAWWSRAKLQRQQDDISVTNVTDMPTVAFQYENEG